MLLKAWEEWVHAQARAHRVSEGSSSPADDLSGYGVTTL